MKAFANKEELVAALADSMQFETGCESSIAKLTAKDKAVYVPHLYRGGWVVRGFGFSVERIGVYIPQERAGNPLCV